MKRLYMFFSLLLCCILHASAQDVMVNGTVSDEQSQPLPGVSVKVAGTTRAATTNAAGKFSILAPANSSLVFSYLSYKSQTVSVDGRTNIDISMQGDEKLLETVTVTALGIERKTTSLTYATQNVSSEELNKVKDNNFINSLAGKSAGVVITKGTSGPGSSSKIIIRGQKSISVSSAPIYVIDGIPIGQAAGAVTSNFSDTDNGDALSNLNPEDIESVQLLKGAAAAALYGSSAANGAVLITTKKGRIGEAKVDFSSSTMLEKPFDLPETQTRYGRTATTANDMWGAKTSTSTNDFIKDFFETGKSFINAVSFTGGNQQAQFYLSYANTKATGIVPNNSLLKHNFTLRGSGKFFKDRLTLDGSINYINQKMDNPPKAGFYYSPIFSLYLFPTDDNFGNYDKDHYEVWNPTRGLNDQNWPYIRNEASTNQNPYWIANRNLNENFNGRTISSFKAKVDITNWLNVLVRTTLDINDRKFESKNYAGTDAVDAGSGGALSGTYSIRTNYETNLYSDILLNANKQLSKDFSLTATLGASDNRNYFNEISTASSPTSGLLFPNVFSINNFNVASGAAPFVFYQHTYKGLNQAIFATASIGYKETLFLDGTGRREWSYTTEKAYNYPSVGVSYILTNTTGTSDLLSFAKLRASYAEVGTPLQRGANNSNPPKVVESGTGSTKPVTNLPYFSGDFRPILQPERTKSVELGAQVRLFKDKLGIDLTVYNADTKNQVITIKAPAGAGADNFILNGGEIRNRGFEGIISYSMDFGDLKWQPALNFSHNQNQVRALSPLYTADRYVISSSDGSRLVASFLTRPTDGKYGSFGDYYGRTILTNADGSIQTDADGIPILSEQDATYVGNPNPKFLAGFNNNFKYKQYTLSFLIDSRFGGKVYSQTQAWLDFKGASQRSADARDAGGVMVNGKMVDAQTYYARISGGGNYAAVPEYTYSATNIRLRELALGYTFPVIGNVFKNLNISLTGRNLFFFHKDAPFDPEASISAASNTQGIDAFGLPATRSYGFSVRSSF